MAPENKYLYNGKELNGDYDIKLMDYGARWYDGAIGRWTAVDPLAEKTFSWSEYHYVLGNPIRLIDPFGLSAEEKDVGYYRRKAVFDAWQEERDAKYGFFSSNGQSNFNYPRIDAFVVNETSNSRDSKYRLSDLADVLINASSIFEKNGFDNIKYNFLTSDEAKTRELGASDLFIGVLSSPARGPGASLYNGFGEITKYSPQGDLWTFVNYQWAVDNHNNPTYATGYLIAHELLHQILSKAGFALERNGKKFSHFDDIDNLNRDGKRVTIPSGPSDSLRQAEVIIDSHRDYIHSYFIWLGFHQSLNKK